MGVGAGPSSLINGQRARMKTPILPRPVSSLNHEGKWNGKESNEEVAFACTHCLRSLSSYSEASIPGRNQEEVKAAFGLNPHKTGEKCAVEQYALPRTCKGN